MLDHAVRIKPFNIHLSQFIVFTIYAKAFYSMKLITLHHIKHLYQINTRCYIKLLTSDSVCLHVGRCATIHHEATHHITLISLTSYYTHITHIILHSYHSHFNALTSLTSYYANITHTIVHSHHSHHSYHIELISLTSYYTDITHTILHSHHSHHITLISLKSYYSQTLT